VDSRAKAAGFEMLLKAMRKIGFATQEAPERLERAREKLSGGARQPGENDILREAIRC